MHTEEEQGGRAIEQNSIQTRYDQRYEKIDLAEDGTWRIMNRISKTNGPVLITNPMKWTGADINFYE